MPCWRWLICPGYARARCCSRRRRPNARHRGADWRNRLGACNRYFAGNPRTALRSRLSERSSRLLARSQQRSFFYEGRVHRLRTCNPKRRENVVNETMLGKVKQDDLRIFSEQHTRCVFQLRTLSHRRQLQRIYEAGILSQVQQSTCCRHRLLRPEQPVERLR